MFCLWFSWQNYWMEILSSKGLRIWSLLCCSYSPSVTQVNGRQSQNRTSGLFSFNLLHHMSPDMFSWRFIISLAEESYLSAMWHGRHIHAKLSISEYTLLVKASSLRLGTVTVHGDLIFDLENNVLWLSRPQKYLLF